jgi:acetyl-CoA carboxylase biotin carboxyl carrier protein
MGGDGGLDPAPPEQPAEAEAEDEPEPVAGVGDSVEEGQTIGYIDVLGVSHEVFAPAAGVIERFLVMDGQPVEYGQPLARIVPPGEPTV